MDSGDPVYGICRLPEGSYAVTDADEEVGDTIILLTLGYEHSVLLARFSYFTPTSQGNSPTRMEKNLGDSDTWITTVMC